MVLIGSVVSILNATDKSFDGLLGMLEGADRQQEVDQAAVFMQQLGIANFDRSLGVRRNGEDAGLKQSVPHVFEQSRIALASDDFLVDFSRVVLVEQSARQFFAVVEQRKVADGRVFGDRKQELSLDRVLADVLKDLRHADFGRLIVHVGQHVDRADLVGRPDGRTRHMMAGPKRSPVPLIGDEDLSLQGNWHDHENQGHQRQFQPHACAP